MGRRSVFVLFDCAGSAAGFPLSERQLHQRFEIVAAGVVTSPCIERVLYLC